MEHVSSWRKDECLFIDPNMENFHGILSSNHEDQESPFFSGFPSPFFDDTHDQHKPICLNITTSTEALPCESKRVIKKKSVGKKDRHSKIHTAQGLRDRRMRLSLEIARKFFHLQDLLGFDKASNTIEWLFSKSNKAIKEVAQSMSHEEEEESCQVPENAIISKPAEKKEIKQQIPNNNNNSSSSSSSSSSVLISCCRETREQKRARARDRTRERLMMKQLEKSSKPPQLLFVDPPKDEEIYKLGLGCCLASPNYNYSVEMELGFMSSPPEPPIQQADSSSSPSSLEYSSSIHHPNFLQQRLQSSTIDNVNSFENYSGGIVGTSTAAGWLSNGGGLLGMPAGEWEAAAAADRFISEYYYYNNNNYEITPTTAAPLTGDIYNYEQNPSSFFMSSTTTTTTNILHF